jgi:hypothetical protein
VRGFSGLFFPQPMDRDFVALILLAGAAIFAALVIAQYYGIVHVHFLSDLSALVHADQP